MDKEQLLFAQTLEQLKETARLQENMLTSEQIQEAFEAMSLGEAQMALIHEYLQKNNIGIDEPGKLDENLTDEDVNYLNIYLDELKELSVVSDGEKRAVMMSAMAQDVTACNKLVEIFLPQVVEIAKLYAGQGALVEDLIGEGNVALATAVTMLDCVESIDEVEGFLGKMIMDAMQDYIGEDSDSKSVDEQILEKVNRIYEKAKEMAEELLRKVTVAELAKEMEIEEEEIYEAIRLSANHMDYIEEGTNEGQ
ncbi:MAG: hypothetical protein II273_07290 [Lachnospiraceae bacterium]|nr:hypothetical protein [Lachnospiraceae bacterium]MEE1257001.1 hypothetical protein [Lachnospiraceae bacterium]